jgi:hypothetical protein
MRDLSNNFAVRRAIAPVVASDNTALVGQVIDGIGFHSLAYAIATGAIADADASFAVLVEHSDESGSGFAAVPDEYLIGTEGGAGFQFDDDNETRKLGYIGDKRFTRLTITPAANAGNAAIAAVAILGHPDNAPVA